VKGGCISLEWTGVADGHVPSVSESMTGAHISEDSEGTRGGSYLLRMTERV
jgi:hypothetical protein